MKINSLAKNFPTSPSHRPKRFRDYSIISVRPIGDLEFKAVAHFKKLASKWTIGNQFSPPLAPETISEWHVQHHPKCSSRKHALQWCDCGFLVLVRYSGHTFAIGENGELSPYSRPPATLADVRPNTEYPFLLNSRPYLIMDLCLGGATAFVLVGKGKKARVVGKVGVGMIQNFLNKLRREAYLNRVR